MRKKDIEMSKFNGKISVEEGLETASEVTSATRLSKKDGKKAMSKGSRSSSPEKVLSEMAAGDPLGTIDRSETGFDPHPEETAANVMDEEEEAEAERMLEEEKQKKSKEQTELPEFFVQDMEGQQFNPRKKFGNIEDDGYLIYENVTSSYPVNLPVEMY